MFSLCEESQKQPSPLANLVAFKQMSFYHFHTSGFDRSKAKSPRVSFTRFPSLSTYNISDAGASV